MGPIGVPELLVIFVIALIVFGPKKLPELGRSLGKSMAEFKRASFELRHTLEEEVRLEEQKDKQKAALASTAAAPAAAAPEATSDAAPSDGSEPDDEASRSIGTAPPAAESTSPGGSGEPPASPEPASPEPALTSVAGGETVARGNVSH